MIYGFARPDFRRLVSSVPRRGNKRRAHLASGQLPISRVRTRGIARDIHGHRGTSAFRRGTVEGPREWRGLSGGPRVEISIRGLTKSFGSQTVLEDITCDIPKGKISLMLGPFGTGKSVFLKNIMGLLKPEEGEIWIGDKNVPALPHRELYEVRRKFGVLFQDGALFGSMSVYDNTAFPLREHTKKGEKEIKDIVMEKLEMVGLVGAESKLPGEISGGMKKRAGLARALVLDPEIIMFDEPDSG